MDGNDLLILGGVFFGFLLLSKQVSAGTSSATAASASSAGNLANYLKQLLQSSKSGASKGSGGGSGSGSGTSGQSSAGNTSKSWGDDIFSNMGQLLQDEATGQAVNANNSLIDNDPIDLTETPSSSDSYIPTVDSPTEPTDIFNSVYDPSQADQGYGGSGGHDDPIYDLGQSPYPIDEDDE